MSLTANACDERAPTRTHAAIPQNAATQASTVIMKGYPAVDATQSMPMEKDRWLHIVVDLNQRNTAQLQKYLKDVISPGSPGYQKFLTPEQFKAKFSPTDAQVCAVVAYLEKSGFTRIQVAPNNMLVGADGTAMSVDAAFNANMHTFNIRGKQHFSNASDVTVPRSLGGIVQSVLGLQDVVAPHVLPTIGTYNSVGPQAGDANTNHEPAASPAIHSASSSAAASNPEGDAIDWYGLEDH